MERKRKRKKEKEKDRVKKRGKTPCILFSYPTWDWPLTRAVPPTESTFGEAAGKSGNIFLPCFRKHCSSVRPWQPESPDATTMVVPIRPIF